jgi:hypothetical protein
MLPTQWLFLFKRQTMNSPRRKKATMLNPKRQPIYLYLHKHSYTYHEKKY